MSASYYYNASIKLTAFFVGFFNLTNRSQTRVGFIVSCTHQKKTKHIYLTLNAVKKTAILASIWLIITDSCHYYALQTYKYTRVSGEQQRRLGELDK